MDMCTHTHMYTQRAASYREKRFDWENAFPQWCGGGGGTWHHSLSFRLLCSSVEDFLAECPGHLKAVSSSLSPQVSFPCHPNPCVDGSSTHNRLCIDLLKHISSKTLDLFSLFSSLQILSRPAMFWFDDAFCSEGPDTPEHCRGQWSCLSFPLVKYLMGKNKASHGMVC